MPAVRATGAVEISYGLPTHEAWEAELRGEIVLGGRNFTYSMSDLDRIRAGDEWIRIHRS